MKRFAQHFHQATLLFCLVLAFAARNVAAQGEPLAKPDSLIDANTDIVFTEIELSPEGVTAYDSVGNQWLYDFDRERFIPDGSGRGETGRGRDTGSRDEALEPVEERCIEEKRVDYPALKAVYVGRDEYVDDDILASGRVTVKGWVKGSVRSFSKTVLVTSTGQVDGDVRAPEVVIKPGGIVRGEVIESRRLDIPLDTFDDQLATEGIWVVFAFTLALTLIVFLTASLAPRQMTNMTECVRRHPARSLLMGMIFFMLCPAIVILVAVTIVGLLVVWLIPIAYLVAFALGMGASGFQVSGPLVRRYFGITLGSVATPLSGVVMYMAVWALVAVLLGSSSDGGSVYGFGIFLLVISILGTIYPFLIGIGAAVLTRFGFRPYIGRVEAETPAAETAPAPAPPPIPEGPASVRRPSPPPPADPASSQSPGES